MTPLLHTLGRMHIVLLHLPIGLLLGVAAWEMWRAWRGRRRAIPMGHAAVFLAWLSVLGSAAAIGTGLAHELELADQADAIWLHKWLGIAAGVMSLITAILASAASRAESVAAARAASDAKRLGVRTRVTSVYRASLFLTVGVLIPAGHFGGDLTHGEGYIIEPLLRGGSPSGTGGEGGADGEGDDRGGSSGGGGALPGGNAQLVEVTADARRVLATYCASCHGTPRVRGGLRVDTADNILRGGNSGPVLVPGDADASLLVQRMLMPLHEDGHMPPSDRPQPTTQDIDAVRQWIRSMGVSLTSPVPAPNGANGATNAITRLDPAQLEPGQGDRLSAAVPLPASVSMGLDLSTMEGLDDTRAIAILHAMNETLTSLSVANTNVTDTLVVWLESTPRLRTLDLSGTRVTDACVQSLAAMPALTSVRLARTELSEDAIDWLSFARPELEIVTAE